MSTAPSTSENDPNLSGLGRALLDTGGSKPSTGPWVPPTAEELHAILPQYEIVKMLGRGGMGAVYMGRQTSLERPVAIKILSSKLEDSDQGFNERFKNEAKAMAKLNHPGIVSVYDFGSTAGGLLYIVMEYVDGTDVARMIAKSGRLHTEHAMAITAHVCDALAYAHERGIIHRDIKPANIMVGYDGEVKVADFGLAKVNVGGHTMGLTVSGMAMGTLHFMAPEALMLGTAVDHRADIYAVGVMLYQMLTGKLPQGMFKMPSLLVSGLDPRYDGIIAKAIMEDREARYQSAREMRADLDSILTQPVFKVETPAAAASGPPAVLPTQARPQRPGARAPQSPRSMPQPLPVPQRSLAWLWVLISLLVLAAGGAWIFRPREKPTAEPLAAAAASAAPASETSQPAVQQPSTAREETENWISLFNGKDLSGWELHPSNFPADVHDGMIRIQGSSTIPVSGNMYYRGNGSTLPQWRDFEVICTVKTENKGNSGIFLHSSPGMPDKNLANGVEVQIWNDLSTGSSGKSGSLQRVAVTNTARFVDGEWFQVKTRVEGMRVQTWLKKPTETDWLPAVDWTQPSTWSAPYDRPGIKLGSGTISLQNNPPLDGVVWFKEIKFRLLNAPAAASTAATSPAQSPASSSTTPPITENWQSLFNGKDLTGWEASPPNFSARVIAGALKIGGVAAREDAGHLFYVGKGSLAGQIPEWKNFELITTLKTVRMGNSGLRIHSRPISREVNINASGPEINIWNEGMTTPVDKDHRTGGIMRIVSVPTSYFSDGEWFDMKVRVENDTHLQVWLRRESATAWIQTVDWTQTASWKPPQLNPNARLSSGTIAFTNWVPEDGEVWVRDIKIRSLDTGLPPTPTSSATAPSSTSLTQTFGGHRYQFVPGSFSWQEARAKAESLGGHLATITSKEENEFLLRSYDSLLPTMNRNIWLGAIQENSSTSWKWVTGEPFAYTGWVENEPNGAKGGGGEVGYPFMLNLYSFRGGVTGWNDSSTHESQTLNSVGFIVEWEASSSSSSTPPSPIASPTLWIDTKGRSLQAKFVRLEGANVLLDISGKTTPVLLSTLSDASQQIARQLQLAQPQLKPPSDWLIGQWHQTNDGKSFPVHLLEFKADHTTSFAGGSLRTTGKWTFSNEIVFVEWANGARYRIDVPANKPSEVLSGIIFDIDGRTGARTQMRMQKTVAKTDSGWVPLFPNDSLSGWTGDLATGRIANGILTSSGGRGSLISPKEYGDFHLKFDLRLGPGANNGIGIWREPIGGSTLEAPRGFEVQVLDDTAEEFRAVEAWQRHAGIYYFKEPISRAMGPVGSWNTHEIQVEGNQLKVFINDKLVQDADLTRLRPATPRAPSLDVSRKRGHLILLGNKGVTEFRNMQIKELP